jgi:diadenosine tetraphosphate (Ap4A) HIT family hydrolase
MAKRECSFCRGLEQYRHSQESPVATVPTGMLVADLPASVAVLSLDQYYRGYTLVVAKTHATELFQLAEAESSQYMRDMLRVAQAIARAFTPDKMNYELLGNTVPHLHWHLVPRYSWDHNPTRPIWEYQHEPKLLPSADYEEIASLIRAALD